MYISIQTTKKLFVTHYKTPITNHTPPHPHTSDSVHSGFGSNESEGDLSIPSGEVEEGGIRDSVVKRFWFTLQFGGFTGHWRQLGGSTGH